MEFQNFKIIFAKSFRIELLEILIILSIIIPTYNCLNNGLALTPPMGWMTWERYRCNTDCKNFPDECIRYCKTNIFY